LSTDPENYDFTLWTTSPARGAGTEDSNIGDPNWNTDPSTHVATVNITADATNSLKAAIDAALPGDVIILAAGTYEESENISLDKEITIKAADGASPVVKPVGVFALGNAADVTIQNIKFDGSDQTASNFIYALDATNNSLTIDGCEFYSFENAVISATDSKLISTCTVNRCYFYNNTNSCICLKNTAEADLTVTNSTFANINASSVSAGIVESKTSAGKVKADHCTFYNCPVSSTGYAAIKFESSDITVSNNIIVMPTSTDNIRAIHLPDGKEVKNCLTYGYTYDSKSGIRYGVTQTACLPNTDPYFTDAASGDFSFPYNWSTGVLSPAFGAATDGKPLGAPRWFTNEVVPETDMATPYFLEGKIAKLSGNIYYSAADSLHYEDKVDCGSATWKLHIEEPCAIRATINYKTGSSSGAILALSVYNADEDQVDDAMTHSYYSEDGNKDLTGCVYIPVAGDYTFVLENTQSHSSAKINGITLSYMGGEVQEISTSADTSLPLDEAWFIGCTRDEDGITYPSSNTTSAWIKWNIATTETKFYDLTLNINTTYNHELAVNIYEDENEAPIATVSESYSSTHGSPLAIELGRVQLVGDKNYIAKVTNSANGSQAEVLSLVFKPVTSLVVELPNTIPFINAVLSDKAHITDGKLYFNEIGDTNPQGQWAQWKVTTNHNGLFLFTMNTESTNEQDYKIAIWNEAGTEVVDFCEASLGSGTKVLTHYFNLAAGNYFVKVENTRSYSRGHLTSFVVTEPESSSIITLSEEATSNSDWSAKVNDGTYDVQIIRTIKAGMYNTFCLPFAVSSSMVKQIFGKDVQIRTLNEATLESDFVLTLNFAEASDIHPGTPVLIQTSRDIVNPAFVGVQFGIAAPSATTKTNANFTGTFVKTSLEANENILFLGANNKLYFPTATVDIYGMRGWFIVHDVPGGAPAIRGARIVTPNNMPTEIELVKSEEPKANSQKLIENGQLVIIRDGVRYNAMGVRVK
jgi:hypothetical protein